MNKCAHMMYQYITSGKHILYPRYRSLFLTRKNIIKVAISQKNEHYVLIDI